jgi:hypothetical protein
VLLGRTSSLNLSTIATGRKLLFDRAENVVVIYAGTTAAETQKIRRALAAL